MCGSLLTIALALNGVGIWSLVIGDVLRSGLQLIIGFVVAGRGWSLAGTRTSPVGCGVMGGPRSRDRFLSSRCRTSTTPSSASSLGPVALGLYTIAFRVAILPFLTVTYVIAGVAFPLYARLPADPRARQQVLQATMRACCSLVFLMGAGLAALAPFLEVLGHRWQPAVPVARLLGLYICLRSAAFMVSMLLRVVSPVANALLRGAWVVLLVALIATIGRSGIVAVGAIQVVVAAPMLGAYLFVAHRLAGIDVTSILGDIGRVAVAALIAALATVGLHNVVGALSDPASVGALVVLTTVFAAVYAIALALIVPGAGADLRRLRSLAASPPKPTAVTSGSPPTS